MPLLHIPQPTFLISILPPTDTSVFSPFDFLRTPHTTRYVHTLLHSTTLMTWEGLPTKLTTKLKNRIRSSNRHKDKAGAISKPLADTKQFYNPLKLELDSFTSVLKNSVPTAQERHYDASATKTNRLTLFMEITTIYYKNHMKHNNRLLTKCRISKCYSRQ
jgi:hypothetical protein